MPKDMAKQLGCAQIVDTAHQRGALQAGTPPWTATDPWPQERPCAWSPCLRLRALPLGKAGRLRVGAIHDPIAHVRNLLTLRLENSPFDDPLDSRLFHPDAQRSALYWYRGLGKRFLTPFPLPLWPICRE